MYPNRFVFLCIKKIVTLSIFDREHVVECQYNIYNFRYVLNRLTPLKPKSNKLTPIYYNIFFLSKITLIATDTILSIGNMLRCLITYLIS